MKLSDYPCLFQSSDSASLIEQKSYINLCRIDFSLVVLAAFFSGFSLNPSLKIFKWCAFFTLISLILSFCLKLIIKIGKWDKKWFDTRAVAESVKTVTWRYIMGVEPYEHSLSAEDLDRKFVSKLDEILKPASKTSGSLAKNVGNEQQISNRMREVRQMNIEERKTIYLQQRIKDQKDWYSKKAEYNSGKETMWFWVTIIVELLAIFTAIYIFNTLYSTFNPIGTFTTIVVVFTAWNQTKKYGELSQSYTIAAQELISIESLAVHINNEEKLSDYVRDTENAISREHTMWCAKRV
jgi:hypothetical protein